MLAVAEIRTRLLGETYAPDDQLLGFGLREPTWANPPIEAWYDAVVATCAPAAK